MSIFYKIQGYDLTTSSLTTVLTINTSSVAIVKEISIANDTGTANEVNFFVRDESTTTSYKFYHNIIPSDSTDGAVNNTLVLEEGDSLQFQSSAANAISGQISYALLTRTGENG
jgi:hypothetical protein